MVIGQKIKQLRSRENLSQEQLANKLNLSSQAISNWERGKSFPDIMNIISLSDIFGVSLDDLLKDDVELQEKLISSKKDKWKITGQSFAFVLGLVFIVLVIYVYFTKKEFLIFPFITGLLFVIESILQLKKLLK
ncbi:MULTISPECIES: helix-turn-helix transcriptional regulator [unclassified Lysinibacillus]|uniref:helix-turn-helix domain-containing protein n=1 Tax=unclassified Lysinibacillus TaxID=2636778 RepID=UPI00255452CC|nr:MULTISPECIES: helix-turn-helix transcriptional regulator [unclassified Lysinibacillus]MDM5250986.1 helix-turn-helix transcriptional regulator [Lysinibacillus sp. G4S2]